MEKRTNVISLAASQCRTIFLKAAAIAIQFSHPYLFFQILVQLFKKKIGMHFLLSSSLISWLYLQKLILNEFLAIPRCKCIPCLA